MASYDASINVRVSGTAMVDGVINRVQELERLVRNVNTRPLDLSRAFGRGDIADRFGAAARELNSLKNSFINSERAVEAFGTTAGRTIANTTALASAFRQIAANSDVATAQFREFTVAAQQAAVAANSLGRARLAILAEELSGGTGPGGPRNPRTPNPFGDSRTSGGPGLVNELIAQRAAIPNSISALNAYQGELRELQQLVTINGEAYWNLERAIRGVDRALNLTKIPAFPPPPPGAPRTTGGRPATGARSGPPPGSLEFNPNPSQENLALGAGFPLLFGGGPGQVAGGLIGSMFGSGFGGQILGAAIGQQLTDALARIKQIGDATKTLNMDNLRTSAVYVNSQLETTVRLLVESGKAQEALAYTAKEVAEQLGTTPEVLADINGATNALTTEWDRFIGLLSTNLATIAAPFVAALTLGLGALNGLLEAANKFNALWTGALKRAVDAVIDKFPPLRNLIDDIGLAFGGMTEEQQKLAAALDQDIDKSMASLKVKREILDLEKQRTKGYTQRDRLADIEIDRQQKLKQIEAAAIQEKIELQNKYKDLVGTPNYANLAVKLKEVDAAKRQNIEELDLNTKRQVGLELLNKQYTAQEEALNSLKQQQRYKDAEIGTYTAIGSIVSARIGAEQQLVSLKTAQLERDYDLATNAQKRYDIAIRIFKQNAEAAALQYQQTLAGIAIEVEKNKLQVDRNVLKGYEILAEGKLQILQSKTAEEEAKKKLALQDALNAQNMVIQGSVEQLSASKLIAQAQSEAAGYQYKAGILAAGTALQQKLVSSEIGLTATQAANVSTNMINAYSSTSAMNNIATNLSDKLGTAAQDLQASQTAALATTTQFSIASVEATQRQDAWRASVLASNAAQDEAARKEAAVAQAAQQAAATRIAELRKVIDAARAGDKEIVASNGFSVKILQSNWAMLLGYIKGLYSNFLRGLLGGVNNAIGAINSVIRRYNSLPTPPFPDVPQLGYLQIPAFAEGGLVTGPTLAMVGEGGESEYIIPESKMATAAANYLAGGRGAGIMEGGGGGSAPSINITTGPVVEFNGERYVTMRDMERGLQQMATNIYSGLRTPSGRYAVGVR